jgi:hypothetical protein
MIFERHFEDKCEEAPSGENEAEQTSAAVKQEDLSVSSGNPSNSDACSIDAEPY